MAEYCMNCMSPLEEGNVLCPVCGYDTTNIEIPADQLKPGTRLDGNRYIIGKALGQGGFGITYIARDTLLNKVMAIKEFFPHEYAQRQSMMTSEVTLRDQKKMNFLIKGKEKFLQEARSLAQFQDIPGIVKVINYFEENNTAYIVMDFLEGTDLRNRIKTELFQADELFQLMDPLFQALKTIHEKGLIHRDISPDNIMLRKDGHLTLMDFGAARGANYVDDDGKFTVILKPGYAPLEQYDARGNQGSWSDIYALCATIYKCITGVTPPNPYQRKADKASGNGDPLKMPSELGFDISPEQERMLKKGMEIEIEDRPRTISDLLKIKDEIDNETTKTDDKPVHHYPPKLFVIYSHNDWEFDLKGEQSFGRQSKNTNPDLYINVKSVSRNHGRFFTDFQEQKYSYQSEESTNGTLLNGEMLTPGQMTDLEDGDILAVRPKNQGKFFDVKMIFSTSYVRNVEWRYLGDLNEEVQEVILGKQSRSGMKRDAFDVKYASLFFSKEGCVLIDNGKNEIRVNHEIVDQACFLNPMDVLCVKGYYLLYTGESILYQTEINAPYLSQLGEREVTVSGDEQYFFSVRPEESSAWKRFARNTLFKNYNIYVAPGNLILIMGGTDILEGMVSSSDFSEDVSRVVKIPGHPALEREYRRTRNRIAYVSQSDELRIDSTVYELVRQAVSKSGVTEDNSDEFYSQVEEVLQLFQLGSVRDTSASQLKYSERRILKIAIEYAGDPILMYVDYPTNGMDVQTSRKMIRLLKTISARGKIVLMTSNRPDIEAELLDGVFVLNQDTVSGNRILEFAGSREQAYQYFGVDTLEDILTKIEPSNYRRR